MHFCFSFLLFLFFFFKQKTAYEMRISDWSSDVCSSDLTACFRWCARHLFLNGGVADKGFAERSQQFIARSITRTLDAPSHRDQLLARLIENGARRIGFLGIEGLSASASKQIVSGDPKIACKGLRLGMADLPAACRSEPRSEERRVGKEGVSACRYGGPPVHEKKKKKK